MYRGDKVALDNLRNQSICVFANEGIRNIENENDMTFEKLAFVNNISPCESKCELIKIGEMVRYRIVACIPL